MAVAIEELERAHTHGPALQVVRAPTDPDFSEDKILPLIYGWRRLRAHFERTGDVEREGYAALLDIERMVTSLEHYRIRHPASEASDPAERRRRRAVGRDARQAAEMIAAYMVLGRTSQDSAFPHRARRLERKVIAFGVPFLAGCELEVADRAFEEA